MKTTLILILSLAASSCAFALDDIEGDVIRAKNEYFNGLMAGQGSTPESLAALYKRTEGASDRRVMDEIRTRWLQEAARRTAPPSGPVAGPVDSIPGVDPNVVNERRAAFEGKKSHVVKHASVSAPLANVPNQRPHQEVPEEEVGLDGSKVPRILDFKGGAQDRKPADTP